MSVASPLMQKFGRNLRDVRHARGITQEALARVVAANGCRIHQATLYKFESGHRRYVTLDEAVGLAIALEVDPAQLLGLTDLDVETLVPDVNPMRLATALRDSAKALVEAADNIEAAVAS